MAELPVSVRFEGVSPILGVADLAKALDYYVDILGFAIDWSYEKGIASVSRDRCSIFLSVDGQGKPGTWVCGRWQEVAKQVWERLLL